MLPTVKLLSLRKIANSAERQNGDFAYHRESANHCLTP